MRAKLEITSVEQSEHGETLEMKAVGPNEAYPEDGSDENNTFARFTPSAELKMVITNPDLHGQFETGQTFYVDFHEAPD